MEIAPAERLKPIIVAALATCAVAGLGASMTSIGSWYHDLAKPGWTPPDPAFGAIWTIVFSLAAISSVLAWRQASDRASKVSLIGTFALNGFFNIMWSLLFFRLQKPDWALVEAVFFWSSIVAMIIVAGRLSRRAGWLLTPYLAWVSTAVLLNWEVVKLNGPFG